MVRRTFEAAVERHQRAVFTFAAYFLGDRTDAEDVTQEVLVRLWRNPRLLSSARLGGWMLRVTRNACCDVLRQRRSRGRLTVVGVGAEEATVVDARPDPEVTARASELGQRLRSALAGLHEPQRSVVILREIQGLSYREIGDVLDLPLSTVRVTLHRARRRLREQLREEYANAAAV